MEPRKPIDAQAGGVMLLLCMTWALQQIAVKAVAAEVAPVFQIGLRSAVSALLVAALMWRQGTRADWRATWRAGLAVGALFALEYLLVAEGLRHTSASHMVVFLYTAPVFAALGLHWRLPAERLRPLQWGGIALAFGGIALAFLGRTPSGAAGGPAGATALLGDLLGLLGGVAWGATTVVLRCSRLGSAPATLTLLYQLLAAAVLLLAGAAATGQTRFEATLPVLGSLGFQAVVVSFASFLAWFRLLRTYLASRLGVFTFLTPLFGVGFGVALLGEPLEPGFVRGALLVLAGIALVSGHGWLAQRLGGRGAAAQAGSR